MNWLNVPHLQQTETGWCLPACVAMVTAYWQRPLPQSDVARWLGTRGVGTPASRIQWLAQRGFEVVYRTGSLPELEAWITQGMLTGSEAGMPVEEIAHQTSLHRRRLAARWRR